MMMAKLFEYRDAERESADQYAESLNTVMMVAALLFDGVIMILIEGELPDGDGDVRGGAVDCAHGELRGMGDCAHGRLSAQ